MLGKLLELIVQRNLYVFPLEANRKKPEITEWETKATKDPQQIQKWAQIFPDCNWGVACGPSNLIVLDSDMKNEIDGPQKILETGNEIPQTLTIRTPSGGLHRYYQGQGGNRVRFLQNNDTRGRGGYVVAPFSKIGGNVYTIIDPAPIAHSPAWLSNIAKPATKAEDQTPVTELDLPENVSRADAFLQKAPVSIEGDGGDETAFKTAARLRDLGISDSVANDMMLTLWNPRCQPPWEPQELWQKISNAYRYSRDRPGNDTRDGQAAILGEIFEPVKIEAKTRQFRDLGLCCPQREWIIPEWIPAGGSSPTLFTGDGGTGKSQLALQLAAALATGTPWLGFPTKQTPVLYVSCEDDDDELDRRMFSIRKQSFLPADGPLWVMPRVGKSSTLAIGDRGRVSFGPFYPELDEVLSQLPEGPKVLFLDTAADMFAGNENDRGEVNGFSKVVLSKLGMKHHTTIILISHPPKANNKGESATYSGSTAWNNAVRARLFLKYQDKKKNCYRILSNEKSNYSEAGKEITLQYSQGVYLPVAEVEVFSVLDSAVFEVIANSPAEGKYSLRKQAKFYLGDAKIVDSQGQKRSGAEVIESAKRLIRAGKIEEITGKHSGNGLSVVKDDVCPFD